MEAELRPGGGFRYPPPLGRALQLLAGRQFGVVATRQLLALGFSRDGIAGMVRKGWLVPVHRGVFAVGHVRLASRGIWMAAVLACGPGALLSHRSAACLWGIAPHASDFSEVLATKSGRRHDRVLVHRTRAIHPDDRATADGIAVTSVPRTLLDLADVVSARRLERAFEEADRLRLLSPPDLQRLIERSNGRRHRKRLAVLLAAARPVAATRSELERRFIDLVDRAGLPRPLVNAILLGHEVDMLWPEAKVVVELDGFAYHSHRAAFERDRAKRAALIVAGYSVLEVTWRRLDLAAADVVGQLRALVA